MSGVAASTAFQALLGCDVTELETAGTVEASRQLRQVRGWLDAFEARLSSRMSALCATGTSAPPADVHARNQGVSAAEGRRKERRSKLLEKAGSFGEALASGAVTAEHADVLANVTGKLDDTIATSLLSHEESLLEKAKSSSPEEFRRACVQLLTRVEQDAGVERAERQRRQTSLSRHTDSLGMHHIKGVFDPELGAALFSALDREIDALSASNAHPGSDRMQLAAQALAGFVIAGHQQARPYEAEILVIADVQTLVEGLHDDSVCEYDNGIPLPPETVRRLCCQGRVIPIVLDADGVPINVGRDQRLANRAQRRALRTMYRTCAFDGCQTKFADCEIHHIHPWELGGPTDLHNLLPLCSRHHHLVHELGWRLELAADRTLTIRQPDGQIHATVPIQITPGDRVERSRHRRTNRPSVTALTS